MCGLLKVKEPALYRLSFTPTTQIGVTGNVISHIWVSIAMMWRALVRGGMVGRGAGGAMIRRGGGPAASLTFTTSRLPPWPGIAA